MPQVKNPTEIVPAKPRTSDEVATANAQAEQTQARDAEAQKKMAAKKTTEKAEPTQREKAKTELGKLAEKVIRLIAKAPGPVHGEHLWAKVGLKGDDSATKSKRASLYRHMKDAVPEVVHVEGGYFDLTERNPNAEPREELQTKWESPARKEKAEARAKADAEKKKADAEAKKKAEAEAKKKAEADAKKKATRAEPEKVAA